MDERRTIKSGLPRQLHEELGALAPTLIPATIRGARYRLERLVGRGGLFVTFRATRIDDQGAVPHAVKILRPSLARAWPAGARLLSREQARVLAILNERVPPSPHVVRLLEIGEVAEDRARGVDEAVPYLAFEWIEGDDGAPSLLARVRERVTSTGAALSPRDAIRVLEGVARGLDWVHQHGLLHRGLTASNVMVVGRDAALTAKVTDTAIARPAGLPSTFGMQPIAFDEPFRAPEQNDPRATLTPACDVFALGALVRFVLTGRALDGAPLAGETLHPGFGDRGAVAEVERAIAAMRALAPDARPATVHSAWELVSPALRVLSARSTTAARRSLVPPPPASAPVWTERHRPRSSFSFRVVGADAEGQALASDGHALSYFDGRSFRSVDAAELTHIDTISAVSAATFLVGGRTRVGAARLLTVSCDGPRALSLDASGTIVAAAIEGDEWIAVVQQGGRHFAIDLRGRVPLDGVIRVTHVRRFGDRQWLIAGESDAGFVATFDADSRIVRPHATPLRRAPSAIATSAIATGGEEAFLAGHHGVLVIARRTLDAPRLTMTREQLPTTASPSAIAIGGDGALWFAAGSEIFVRAAPSGYRAAYRDDGTAEVLALVPGRRRMLAFVADGRVIEGRTLADS